jgi:hypothetical protein
MLMLMVVTECRGAAKDHRKASKSIFASSSATTNQVKRAKIPYGYEKSLGTVGSSIYSSWTINNPIRTALSKLFAKVKNNCVTRAPLYNMKKL